MTRHSLHIGIDRYDDKNIQDLPFCTADAELLASFFRDVTGYESVIRLDNPARGAILDAVAEEAGRLSPGDLLVLTYSGHGLRLQGEFSILASDARFELVRAGVDGLPFNLLKDRILEAGVNLVVFLDSCPTEMAGTRGIFGRVPAGGRSSRDLCLEPVPPDGPFFFIMQPEMSLEIPALGHGLFTFSLDRVLRELHARGEASLDCIRERTDECMKAICEEHGMASPPCVNLMRVRGGNERLW